VIGGELLDRVAGVDAIGWGALAAAPFVGSFLGVVVRRVPEGRAITWARSRCEYCGAALRVRDLVPLFSWMAAEGRCRYCGHRLGWFYPGNRALRRRRRARRSLGRWRGGDAARLPFRVVASRSRLDRHPPMAPTRCTDPATHHRRLSRRCRVRSRTADWPGARNRARLSQLAGGWPAVQNTARPRGVGPRRRQAARRVGSLGGGNGTASGGPRRRGFGAFRGRLPSARGSPAGRPLGVALWAVPGACHLGDMATRTVLHVSSNPREVRSKGDVDGGWCPPNMRQIFNISIKYGP